LSHEIKSIVSVIALVFACISAYTMFYVLGSSKKGININIVKSVHKISGFLFFVLTIIISFFCIRILANYNGELPPMSSLHTVSAIALIVVLIVKLSIVHFYKGLIRFAPHLGITILTLAFLTVGTSVGYRYIKGSSANYSEKQYSENLPASQKADTSRYAGNIAEGKDLFKAKCMGCHSSTSNEDSWGPALKGLYKMESLPSSGKIVTDENIISQLREPYSSMPSFPGFSEKEIANLLSYLKSI